MPSPPLMSDSDLCPANPIVVKRSLPDCTFVSENLQEAWPSLSIQTYSNAGYEHFEGFYLTPHNHKNVRNYTKWAALPDQPGRFEHSFCQSQEADRFTWNVQRVGPFSSQGGYDWWKFAGHDVAKLAKVLSAHKTIFIVETMLGASDAQGRMLSYPPMHNHHIHLNREQPYLRFDNPDAYYIDYVLERHGEWAYDASTSEKERDGYGRAIDFPLVLDAEINDARPANSSSFTWYMAFAIKWTYTDLTAVSYVRFLVPNHYRDGKPFEPWSDQGVREAFFFVPTEGKYVTWHSGQYTGHGGRLMYLKAHNHHNLLVKAFMFAASPTVFELSCPRFCSARHEPDEAEVLPLSRFFDYAEFNDLENFLRSRQPPTCTVEPNYAFYDGVAYDRAPLAMCRQWSLVTSQVLTFVTFLEYHREHKHEPWLLSLPASLPMHANWFLAIDSGDSSCFQTFVSTSKGGTGVRPGWSCSNGTKALSAGGARVTSMLLMSVTVAFPIVLYTILGWSVAPNKHGLL